MRRAIPATAKGANRRCHPLAAAGLVEAGLRYANQKSPVRPCSTSDAAPLRSLYRVTDEAFPATRVGDCFAAIRSARSASARPATALSSDNVVTEAATNAAAEVVSLRNMAISCFLLSKG